MLNDNDLPLAVRMWESARGHTFVEILEALSAMLVATHVAAKCDKREYTRTCELAWETFAPDERLASSIKWENVSNEH